MTAPRIAPETASPTAPSAAPSTAPNAAPSAAPGTARRTTSSTARRTGPRTASAPTPLSTNPAAELDRAVSALRGVGPTRARALARLGVVRVRDLLFLLPRRAASASAELGISAARAHTGVEVTVRGRVERVALQRFGGRSTLRVTLTDDTGSLPALFFNQPWLRKSIAIGAELVLRGRISGERGTALVSPRIGTAEKPLPAPGSVTLVYPSAEGVSAESVAKLVRELAARCAEHLADPLAPDLLARHDLPTLGEAVREIHAPSTLAVFERARRRLALEPLLRLQARLQLRRRSRAAGSALAVPLGDAEHAALLALFPFEFTAGQRTVADELRVDLARTVPMRRLLQGDVGTGKTALGVYAALAIARAGGQTAFLAPTELLAEQHFAGLRARIAAAGANSVVLTGSLSAAERRSALAQLESGFASVVFGTHALFSDDVRYRRLALAIIDEQHRFGVAQRAKLIEKGASTHVLLMTATPIPRTLALTLYGDLDTSLLRERPPGRGSVKTRWVRGQDRRRVPHFLRERLEAGERLYWVAPRIGESETENADGERVEKATAERAFAQLSASELARFGIELVHGRLDARERGERLERFRTGAARVLVATTVIEVGVDVPEATVMVIENAERLGLAQLHQLRGRIGRGARDSWCLCFAAASARERMELLERTHDGFEIAEEDLRLRGMGDLAGLRQAGENAEGLDALDLALFFLARDLVAQDAELCARYGAEPVNTVAATP